jgi:hypothetical protein
MAITTESNLTTEEQKIAGNVRAELARRQIERSELRTLLGLSGDSVHRRYRGLTAWPFVELRTIAEYLGVELSTLTD